MGGGTPQQLNLYQGALTRLRLTRLCHVHREGVYSGHSGIILQLLCLGDHLLSLGSDRKLLLWKIGEYDGPEVLSTAPFCLGEV